MPKKWEVGMEVQSKKSKNVGRIFAVTAAHVRVEWGSEFTSTYLMNEVDEYIEPLEKKRA